MTSGLRKAHKIVWLLLAVGGVVFFSFTLSELPFASQKEAQVDVSGISISSYRVENEWVKLTLEANQIQVILKKSLKASSSVVYTLDENGERAKAVGQVSAVGIYRFEVKEPIKGILIVDEIKDVELTKLNF
jgi:hypothetical protein